MNQAGSPPPVGDAAPRKRSGVGRVLIIVGIVVAVFLVLCPGVILALLLPALGKARANAQRVMISAQMVQIHREMLIYEVTSGSILRIDDPKVEGKLASDPNLRWVAPDSSEQEARSSYLFVARIEGRLDELGSADPVVIENPDVIDRALLHVCFGDSSVKVLDREEVVALLRESQPRVFYGDGKPWSPR